MSKTNVQGMTLKPQGSIALETGTVMDKTTSVHFDRKF